MLYIVTSLVVNYSRNMMQNSISIVTPIYKDHYLINDFVSSIKQIPNINLHEIIFVSDGGGDDDEAFLDSICEKESLVKSIIFSRNFGQHIALSAGYNLSSGDLVCMLNVDQQDPPSEILKLVSELENNNYDIVYGLRTLRKDGWLKIISSKAFNWVLNKMTGDNTPLNVSTMRLMSRRFIEHYNELTEKSRYLPGLENWIGFKRGYIAIEHQERKEGDSSYTFIKRINMAVNSIIGFSDLPLRWASFIGMLIALLGFGSLLVLLFLKLYIIDFRPGYISTIAVILFVGGIQILVVGLASLYIGRILKEVQDRPLYIIKKKINFNV